MEHFKFKGLIDGPFIIFNYFSLKLLSIIFCSTDAINASCTEVNLSIQD